MCVSTLYYGDRFVAAFEDGFFGFGRLGDFVLEEIGGCEGVVASDWRRELVLG